MTKMAVVLKHLVWGSELSARNLANTVDASLQHVCAFQSRSKYLDKQQDHLLLEMGVQMI